MLDPQAIYMIPQEWGGRGEAGLPNILSREDRPPNLLSRGEDRPPSLPSKPLFDVMINTKSSLV